MANPNIQNSRSVTFFKLNNLEWTSCGLRVARERVFQIHFKCYTEARSLAIHSSATRSLATRLPAIRLLAIRSLATRSPATQK